MRHASNGTQSGGKPQRPSSPLAMQRQSTTYYLQESTPRVLSPRFQRRTARSHWCSRATMKGNTCASHSLLRCCLRVIPSASSWKNGRRNAPRLKRSGKLRAVAHHDRWPRIVPAFCHSSTFKGRASKAINTAARQNTQSRRAHITAESPHYHNANHHPPRNA